MILVGIGGTIGSGKTTFASYLSENCTQSAHWESWQVIAEVANGLRAHPMNITNAGDYLALNRWLAPLPELVKKTTGATMDPRLAVVTDEKVAASPDLYAKLLEYIELVRADPGLQMGSITGDKKEQFRSLLQWLGGYLAKSVSGDIWYKEIARRAFATPNLQLATIGGVRFPADAAAIHKCGGIVIRIVRPSSIARDTEDITEREVETIPFDIEIVNDGNLPELQSCAYKVYEDLVLKSPGANYTASTFAIK